MTSTPTPPATTEPMTDENDLHVYPTFGREHVLSMECWCGPERDPEASTVVIHYVSQ